MTIFRGELQLLRWAETSTGGATVTFQLADVADLDGFKELTLAKRGMAGQIIAAVMAKVEDELEPAPAVAPAAAPKTKPGELCVMACTFCADPLFQQWAHTQCGACLTDADAKEFILDRCGAMSRKELDTEPSAARRFHKYIREPFLQWKNQP